MLPSTLDKILHSRPAIFGKRDFPSNYVTLEQGMAAYLLYAQIKREENRREDFSVNKLGFFYKKFYYIPSTNYKK